MKIIILSSIMISSAFCGIAQDVSLYNAREHGALAKECLRVVDQEGLPVAGAKVWGGLQIGSSLNDFIPISGTTNTNGEYIIQGKCTNRIRCDITKDGYYRAEFLLPNYGYSHTVKNGKWQPFGRATVITLRRIKGLGKLVVPGGTGSNVGRWSIPAWDRWLGFDLEKFDWTPPYGCGENNDMQIRFAANIKNDYLDFKITMDVCFTNNPFAGAYVCKKIPGSDFAWSECADTNKFFANEFNYVCERRPGGKRIKDILPEDSYMVFRTRTKVDDEGRLVSAHYGVISGAWFFGSETMRIGDACFNNMINDPMIEDGYYLRKAVRENKGIPWGLTP